MGVAVIVAPMDARAASKTDHQRLEKYYSVQQTPYSCSMATARMAIGALTGRTITERTLRKASRVSRNGMSLGRLAGFLQRYRPKGARRGFCVKKTIAPSRKRFVALLKSVQADPARIMTCRWKLPDGTTHHSPIAKLGRGNKRVYVMDVDRGPRWIGTQAFVRAMRSQLTGCLVISKKPKRRGHRKAGCR